MIRIPRELLRPISNKLFLHAAKNSVVIFVAAGARPHVKVVFAVLHLDVFTSATHLTTGEAFWLSAGVAVDEAGAYKGGSLVQELGWDGRDRWRVLSKCCYNVSRAAVAAKAAAQ